MLILDVTFEAYKAPENEPKNRYQDVPCIDRNRIKVSWPGLDNDYIHANMIDIRFDSRIKVDQKLQFENLEKRYSELREAIHLCARTAGQHATSLLGDDSHAESPLRRHAMSVR